MPTMSITVNAKFAQDRLTRFELKQLPFATAKALTEAAKQSQGSVRTALPKKFLLRNKWTSKGIQFQSAQKKDWPDCYSVIGTRDEYMEKQEEGGTLAPKNRMRAIPVAVRPSHAALVPQSQRVSKLDISMKVPQGGRTPGAKTGTHSEPKPFVAIIKSKAGIYRRTGEYADSKRGQREKFKLLYRLQSQPSNYSKREWLQKVVTDVAVNQFESIFLKAFEEAIKDE